MTSGYFVGRRATKPIDYEQTYWGGVVDPDGKQRNRLEERDQFLDDLRQELTFLRNLPVGRILDVGCGLGWLLSALEGGWEKHGVEISHFAASQASQWGKIYAGELWEAQYPGEHFDVVVMHHVIEHMEDPVAAIREVQRILKAGGILLLGTPDFGSGCARRFGENYRLLHDHTHVSLFDNESMHRFLRDHGFVIDKVEYPFFETRHFTPENLMRLFDTSKVSPPFYGNFMTFYTHKRNRGYVSDGLMELSRLTATLAETAEAQVEKAGGLVADCLLAGRKVLACGNGGSAADAQHFVAELVGRMRRERQSLPAISLSTDPSVVTALANDYGYDQVFARQVEGLGLPGDVLLAISTSGRSPNVLKAVEVARRRGLRVVALLGQGGDPGLEACDVCVRVPSPDAQRVQELHMALLHLICEYVERQIATLHQG